MKVEELNLIGKAHDGALALVAAFPDVVFTSGRRNVDDQARAMASNVALKRHWIRDTYKDTPERAELQAWVDGHPNAVTAAQIQAGLAGVMHSWPNERLGRISKHISGEAFDVKPMSPGAHADKVKAFIDNLPGCTFLEKEGGLIRWHAQFS